MVMMCYFMELDYWMESMINWTMGIVLRLASLRSKNKTLHPQLNDNNDWK